MSEGHESAKKVVITRISGPDGDNSQGLFRCESTVVVFPTDEVIMVAQDPDGIVLWEATTDGADFLRRLSVLGESGDAP